MQRISLLAILLFMISGFAFSQNMQKGDFAANLESEGWTLNQGAGTRSHIVFVTFEKPFDSAPTIMLSLTGIDAAPAKDGNIRCTVKPERVTKEGFVIKVQTWADSKVAGVTGSWMGFAK